MGTAVGRGIPTSVSGRYCPNVGRHARLDPRSGAGVGVGRSCRESADHTTLRSEPSKKIGMDSAGPTEKRTAGQSIRPTGTATFFGTPKAETVARFFGFRTVGFADDTVGPSGPYRARGHPSPGHRQPT